VKPRSSAVRHGTGRGVRHRPCKQSDPGGTTFAGVGRGS